MSERPAVSPGAVAQREALDSAMTILIVDDEPAGREILAALLRTQGYQLAFADCGAEALRLAAARRSRAWRGADHPADGSG